MEKRLKFIVVDVGNTSTAIGIWSGGKVLRKKHCDGGFKEASEYVHSLLSSMPALKCISYISVVPSEDSKWRRLAKALKVRLLEVSYRNAPIEFDYPAKETIGADRIADAAGAVTRYGAPLIVMDFGTALTAAVITKDNVWQGGVIAPGFPLMRDYLFERTAKLPCMKIGKGNVPKIGKSTEGAMRFGALVGYRGMVREIVHELSCNFNEDFKLVATGGFAKWALADSGMDFTIDPTLTLYGTGCLAERMLKEEKE
jgi:type III pantothenate kinase